MNNLILAMVLFLATVIPSFANRVNFHSPGNGTYVTSPVEVLITTQGTPQRITLYVDGRYNKTIGYSNSFWKELSLAPGKHTLKATAVFSSRSSSSASVRVTVVKPGTGDSGSGSNPSDPGTGGSTDPGSGSGTPTGGTSSGRETVAQQIAGDMEGLNEGAPHGVPSNYDFSQGPVIGTGNNIGGNAIEFWGDLYVGPNGNPATNTLVNIKGCAVYVLSKSTAKWTTYSLSANDLDGGFYSESFSVDYGTSIPIRHESDGSISFNTTSGKVAHFYGPWPRIAVNQNDIGGLVVSCDARLVLNNANGVDDRGIASFLLDVGADPYPSTTGPGIENNPGIAGGKFKYVQSEWRSFSMSTLSQSELTQNPPPISFDGINP